MVGVALLAGLAVGYDYFFLRKDRLANGLRVRILLYEQIGEDKVFKGSFKGVEKSDEKLGFYVWINKLKKAIDVPLNKDYFYDREFDKALNVCKYSDDDYRVMARLRNNEFYRLEKFERAVLDKDGKPIMEDLEVTNPNTGEVVIEKVPKLEMVEEFVPYVEPMGITQEGREAARFNRVFVKRMQEKRGEKTGFWDKFGTFISIMVIGFVLLGAFVYQSNTLKEINTKNAELWGQQLTDVVEATKNPTWIEGIYSKINEEKLNAEAPAN